MTYKPRHDFVPCVPGAFRGGLSRTEFYDGMVLSEADMKREQTYWSMKRRLTNRALGQGVVWGLSLQWNEKTRCFTLCPGYGLSCCGDDLVVECPETVCEGDLIDPCSEDFRAILHAAQGPCADRCERRPDDPVEACLMLEYVECPENPRQVFEDPCAEMPGGCRFGAMRETTRLRLVPPPAPPPAGPLERFCLKIEALKKMLAEAGLAGPAAAAIAAANLPGDLPSVGINVSIADASGAQLDEKSDKVPGDAGPQTVISFGHAARRLTVSLIPPVGYGFLKTTEEDGTTRTIETLMELSYTDNDITDAGDVSRRPTVVLAPLAGGHAYDISYDLTVRRDASRVYVAAAVTDARKREWVADCATLMQGWVFNTDPACVTRTLLLAALCGWFKGLLGTAPCHPEDKPDETRAAIAWFVCWMAWKLLWKIDTLDGKATDAERCLRKLFEEWCREFHYKGPRCDGQLHGIILGCVQVSPKGRILCFDEWEHRRYVLTGPLLTHWTGLFGIAPLDVMATRLAGWICCVARAPEAELGEDARKALMEHVMANGEVQVGGGFSVSPDFAAPGIFGAFSAGRRPKAVLSEWPAHRLEASLSRRIEARIDAEPLAIAARAPALDYIGAVLPGIPLASLKALGDEEAFDSAVAVMEKAELESVGDLLAIDLDTGARRFGDMLVAEGAAPDRATAIRSVALVQKAALAAIDSVADTVVTLAKERNEEDVFTRADFAEATTPSAIRKAVNQHLRGRGLGVALFKDAAQRVSDG